MSRTLSLALASVASLALLAPTAIAAPAPTDVNEPDAAAAAAAYVATKVAEDGSLGDPGLTADAVLALLAAGGHSTDAMTDYLETRAGDYAGSGGPAAGKLALVAAATGRDATSFGGVDLVAKINESVQADGTCGSWGYALGQALCILGLERAGADVPETLVDNLLTHQDETGAFGYLAGEFVVENDSTGFALAALSAVAGDREAALAAAEARDYLVSAQTDAGYWEGYSPVNATGVVAPALETVGVPQDAAVSWLAGQQLADGSLPSVLDGSTGDVRATVQGLLPFTGESYLSVGEGGTDSVELVVNPEAVERIYGVDRYGTAAAASLDAYAPGVDTVFVATGTGFADALTGSALAGHLEAPILLVRTDSVPEVTAAELARLDPSRVVVLGGDAAVSDVVMSAVGSYAEGNVERISGSNRYGTAAAVAEEFGAVDHVFVATGQAYADALAASAAAGADGVPVLLVGKDAVPPATAARLAAIDPSSITVLGGAAAVSDDVLTELEGYAEVTRVAGANRYETAADLSALRGDASGAIIATGLDYPDALTGAAYAALADVPVLLVKPAEIPPATLVEVDRLAARFLVVVGGGSVVQDEVLTQLSQLNYAG